MKIDPALLGIAAPRSAELETRPAAGREAGGTGLPEVFADALAEARDREDLAVQMTDKFAAGDPEVGIHEVMIAAEEANISLRFATTLKNKAVEAYRELMSTQV